jgi:hypothetical protein
MAKKIVSGYRRDPYVQNGKKVVPKPVGNYPRTVRNQKHVFDHEQKGTYERDVDTYGRLYGPIEYKAKRYKEK